MRGVLIWSGLGLAVLIPVGAAAFSPLLAWRDPAYVIAGFAGVIGLAALLVQPVVALGGLPGLTGPRWRRVHRPVGAVLVGLIVVHVGGLWITSPPDVIDALLFRSPTPFAAFGVVAMWAAFATAGLAAARRKLAPHIWRRVHRALAGIIVLGTVIHAMQIEGTMEPVTKAGLCALILGATLVLLFRSRRGKKTAF